MTEKNNIVFIKHILDSIDAIQDFSKNLSRKQLGTSRLKQSAIVHEIEVIGEAVKNISKDLKHHYPKIPWQDIAGTRDKIMHHYFGVDLDIIWNIIKIDLPNLKRNITKIKKYLEKS
jgi:uncharacterized protein with HEPN domain